MVKVLLFLFSNNFMHYANYFSVLMVILLLFKSKFKISIIKKSSFVWLALASITYCILYLKNFPIPSSSTFYLVFISPVVMYYVGMCQGKLGIETIKNEIIILSFAGVLHGVMNVVKNRGVDILAIAGRSYADIYGGQISGTLQNLFFIMSSSLLFYFLVIEKKKILKIFGSMAGVAGIIGSIVNASRTMIFVTLIIFFMCLFLYFYEKYGLGTSLLKFIGTGIALFGIALFGLWINIFNIQQVLLGSALGQRETAAVQTSSIVHNLRWEYSGEIIRRLPANPFGGIEYAHYAHNLWLDIAKETGIIPFILYLVFSFVALIIAIRVYRDNQTDIGYKYVIVPVIVAFILAFFTEPIMQGSPISFSLFCFVVGGIEGVNVRTTNCQNNNIKPEKGYI